jgi:hypothetical protein
MGTTTLHCRARLISRPLLTWLRKACCGLSWCWQGEQSFASSYIWVRSSANAFWRMTGCSGRAIVVVQVGGRAEAGESTTTR